MLQKVSPLNWRTAIVNPDGTPSPQFIRLWEQMFGNGDTNSNDIDGKASASTEIDTVAGQLVGGGDLSADRTLGLANAGTAGTYGDSTHIARITTDAFGRVTAVTLVALTTPVLVAGLPSAASSTGVRAFVTDATASTFASTVAGGGSIKVPVYSDGTNWKIG